MCAECARLASRWSIDSWVCSQTDSGTCSAQCAAAWKMSVLAHHARRSSDMRLFLMRWVLECPLSCATNTPELYRTATKQIDTIVKAWKADTSLLRDAYAVLGDELTQQQSDGDWLAILNYRQLIAHELVALVETGVDSVVQPLLDYLNFQDLDTVNAKLKLQILQADLLRYSSEVQRQPDKDAAVQMTFDAYRVATEFACEHLEPADRERLRAELNYGVCLYDNDHIEDAIYQCKSAFDDAIDEMDSLSGDEFREAIIVMQKLRDNILLWQEELEQERQHDGEEPGLCDEQGWSPDELPVTGVSTLQRYLRGEPDYDTPEMESSLVVRLAELANASKRYHDAHRFLSLVLKQPRTEPVSLEEYREIFASYRGRLVSLLHGWMTIHSETSRYWRCDICAGGQTDHGHGFNLEMYRQHIEDEMFKLRDEAATSSVLIESPFGERDIGAMPGFSEGKDVTCKEWIAAVLAFVDKIRSACLDVPLQGDGWDEAKQMRAMVSKEQVRVEKLVNGGEKVRALEALAKQEVACELKEADAVTSRSQIDVLEAELGCKVQYDFEDTNGGILATAQRRHKRLPARRPSDAPQAWSHSWDYMLKSKLQLWDLDLDDHEGQ